MTRHIWTSREVAYVKRWYRRRPTAEIAAEIGVSVRAVYVRANALGITESRQGIASRVRSRIRDLHARGYCDTEIAADVGCSREYVGELRREMGLASNAMNDRHRRRVAAKTQEQCRRAGVPNLAALRAKVHRQRAEAAGWPADLRPRHVEILDLLYEWGPQTRRQIAEALGMPWKGSRKSLVSNDPEGSYLAHLIARGLVVCLPRKLPMGGQGRNVSVYIIPLYVKRGERKEHQCAQQTEMAGLSSRRRRSRKRASRNNSAV